MMTKRSLVPNKTELCTLLVAVALQPGFASATWSDPLQTWGTEIRLAMYALAGTLGLCCLMWSGIQWMIARSTGDRSHTFMDYLQQMGVLLVVGGTMAIGAAVWQVYGSSAPA